MSKQAFPLNFIILPCLLTLPLVVFAQKKPKKSKEAEDPYRYTLERNKPDSVNNLHFTLSPLYIDANLFDFNFGLGVSADYYFKNNFMVYGLLNYAYLNLTHGNLISGGAEGEPVAGYSSFSNFEIDGAYFVSSSLIDYTEDFRVKQTAYSETYLVVPSQLRRSFGIKVGFQNLNSIVSGNTIDFKGYVKDDPSKLNIFLGKGNYGTMMHENILSLGFEVSKMHDVIVKLVRGEKKMTNTFLTHSYIDVLYAPSISYDNITWNPNSGNGGVPTTLVVKPNQTAMPFGFRLGLVYNTLKTTGFSYTLEGGLRPGPYSDIGWYGVLKFAMSLNFKTGR